MFFHGQYFLVVYRYLTREIGLYIPTSSFDPFLCKCYSISSFNLKILDHIYNSMTVTVPSIKFFLTFTGELSIFIFHLSELRLVCMFDPHRGQLPINVRKRRVNEDLFIEVQILSAYADT